MTPSTEGAPRRPGFTEGPKFVDAKGRLWYLPVLTASSYDKFGRIRELVGWIADTREERRGEPGPEVEDRHCRVLRMILAMILSDLIESNYHIAPWDVGEMQHGVVFDEESALARAVADAMEPRLEEYAVYRVADLAGLPRADWLAAVHHPAGPLTCIRTWFSRAGDVFLN